MNAASVLTRSIRVTGLLAALALILSLTTVLAPTADATEVEGGDSHLIPISAISPHRQGLIETCLTDRQGNKTCTPDHATTPGSEAVNLRITWSVVGQSESASPSLVVGTPPECKGYKGLVFILETYGGQGELRVQVHLEERNGATGQTSEQVLADQTVPLGADGGYIEASICNYATP